MMMIIIGINFIGRTGRRVCIRSLCLQDRAEEQHTRPVNSLRLISMAITAVFALVDIGAWQ